MTAGQVLGALIVGLVILGALAAPFLDGWRVGLAVAGTTVALVALVALGAYLLAGGWA